MNLLDLIKDAIKKKRVRITDHAEEEMANDMLEYAEVKSAILAGKIIEDYPDDKPFPSCLIYGKHGMKPIHAVCAYSENDNTMILVTVYIPDPKGWINYEIRR